MSQLATLTTPDTGLKKAVEDYTSTIQTKNGNKPSQTDLSNFINTCIASKLNPFKKQAHLVGYDSKNGPTFTTIIGIDGYRAIAQRTGLYAGGSVKELSMKEGKNIPESATFVVRKLVNGIPCEFEATVYYDEAVQTGYEGKPNSIWAKRPKGQLIKCAEGNALRMAFPDELGGMYTDAEIDPEPVNKPELDDFLANNLKNKIQKLAESTSRNSDELTTQLLSKFNFESIETLSESQAKNFNKTLEKAIEKAELEATNPDNLVSEAQLKRLYAMWGEIKSLDPNYDVEAQKSYICDKYGVESTKDLNKDQYNQLSSDYENILNELKND